MIRLPAWLVEYEPETVPRPADPFVLFGHEFEAVAARGDELVLESRVRVDEYVAGVVIEIDEDTRRADARWRRARFQRRIWLWNAAEVLGAVFLFVALVGAFLLA